MYEKWEWFDVSQSDVQDLWKNACRHLEELLHPDVYSRWIAVINPVALDDRTLTLSVDNDFYQTWLEENYLPLIKNAILTVSDSELEIVFSVKPQDHTAEEPEPTIKETITKHFKRRSMPKPVFNPNLTFDSFVVGPSNNFAHAASLAVAQSPAKAYNPLFIYGDVGLGKTHLMQAIGQHVLSTSRASVSYITSETMMNEYIDALQNRSLVQFRKKYRSVDLLLIDDIHFLAGKERMQEEFFHTFNALFDSHKQIVMTSDRPASEITRLERRLVSRFEWGLVTELETPDVETRIAILRNKQEQAEVVLEDSIINYIAHNISSNIRTLEGAFVRAVSYSSLTRKPLTMEVLENLLKDMVEQEKEAQISFESIQRAVADYYDVRVADMSSTRRMRSVAVPRQVAMYLCRRFTRASLPDIAQSFCKTHATVLYAYKTIDGKMDVDDEFRQNVRSIAQRLGRNI